MERETLTDEEPPPASWNTPVLPPSRAAFK
jgi:hypothetical protein